MFFKRNFILFEMIAEMSTSSVDRFVSMGTYVEDPVTTANQATPDFTPNPTYNPDPTSLTPCNLVVGLVRRQGRG